jgi:hypothetical protein
MAEGKGGGKNTMEVGDKILLDLVPNPEILIIAVAEVPHAPERAFATRSGGRHTIGRKVWKADYRWDAGRGMWVRKHP